MLNKKKALIIGAVVVSLLSVFIAYIVSYSSGDAKFSLTDNNQDLSIAKQLQTNNKGLTDERSAKELLELKSKPIIIAIFGSDARNSEPSRSDVIMLMKYYPQTNDAVLVSVPRDTRVEIPGRKFDKINHAYAFGGSDLLTQTLEKLLNIKVDYYLKFDFSDFSTIVNKLGGVEVNSDKEYSDNNTIVPKGISTLNGEQALFYVRFRHDAYGDFGRIKRQQEVIGSLLQKLYSNNTLQSEPLLTEMYSNYLETNLELLTILQYHKIFNHSNQMEFGSSTLATEGKMIDGIYYGIADKDSLASIKKRLSERTD